MDIHVGEGSADEWVLDESFAILGRPFRIRTTSRLCAELLMTTFGDCRGMADGGPVYELRVHGSERRRSSILRDGRPLLINAEPDSVLSLLTWHIMNDAVSSTLDRFVVHAGSVVAPDGRAIVLPAGSGSGKTTLTAALVRTGCGYLSDEMAAFDPDSGLVLAVPRALSIKPGTFAALGVDAPPFSPEALDLLGGAFPMPAADLNAGSLASAAPLGTVVAPSYRAGGGSSLVPISRAQALSELIRNSFNVEAFGGRRAVELLGRILPAARCYRLAVANVDEAVTAVLHAAAES